jgi:hypothetical protein
MSYRLNIRGPRARVGAKTRTPARGGLLQIELDSHRYLDGTEVGHGKLASTLDHSLPARCRGLVRHGLAPLPAKFHDRIARVDPRCLGSQGDNLEAVEVAPVTLHLGEKGSGAKSDSGTSDTTPGFQPRVSTPSSPPSRKCDSRRISRSERGR